MALGSAVLTRGMLFGWSRFDPSVAWSGAGVVGAWAFGPFEGTSRVPVDREMDNALAAEVRWAVESSF